MRSPRRGVSSRNRYCNFPWFALARRPLLLLALASLCTGLSVSIASAQWVAADLFPDPPAPTEAGPHGLEGLGGVIDPSPVLRGLSRLRLQLPGSSMVEMARDGFERRSDGGVTWRGRVTDDEGSRVILTVKDGYMAGRILHGLEEYRIVPGPGRSHIIERIDSSVEPVDEHVDPTVDYSYDIGPVYEPSGYSPNYGNSPDNIQLLVVYSHQALAAAGGEPQIEVRIQSMIDQLNTAFIDSGMIARVALVQTVAADYNDSGNILTDLDWLTTRHELLNFEIHAQRQFYGADLVSMVVDNGGQCAGVAYVMHKPAYDFVSYAYSVTALNCGGAGLAHEIGHNMGFEHNPEDSARFQAGLPTATPFSFGHYVDGSFRTIMSYATPCLSGCPMAFRFSNPNLDFLGFPTGIANERDNAWTGDYTAPIVTDFMDAVTGAVVNRRVAASVEDVEELADGSVVVDSATLELGDGLAGVQAVGLRFQNLNIPVGMRIDSAYLEFEAADIGSDATSVEIRAEAADNAVAFSTTPYDVTGRTATTASVQWDLPAWNTVTEKHYSPDISAVIQEVVDRPGWAENNSMVITVGGTGIRTALAHDGGAASAPLLHVEYASPDRPASISAPVAAYSYSCTGLTCSFTDGSTDSDGIIVYRSWSFGEGTISYEQNPIITFPADGTYTVSLEIADEQGWQDYIERPVVVSAANSTPVAVDDAYTTSADTPVSGNVLTDGTPDSDVDGDPLTVISNTNPSSGTVTIAADGDFTYTPANGFIGSDGFTYTIGDGNGGVATATVAVTVAGSLNAAPVATDNAYVTDEDVAVTGNVLLDGTPDSDPDGDSLTVTGNTSPLNGAVTMAANGDFTYMPDADFNGSDSFTYTIGDGNGKTATATVTVTVNPVNDAPVAAFSYECAGLNCSFTDGSTDIDSAFSGWSWSFGDASTSTAQNPAHAYAADGVYSVTLTVTDDQGVTGTATQTLTVANSPPVATDNVYATDEDAAVSGNVLADGTPDMDSDGDALTVVANTNPLNGTVTVAVPGDFTYTPAADFYGTDSFAYTVSDFNGATATATVTITVNPVNDPPVAAFEYSCVDLTCTFTNLSTDIDDTIEFWIWAYGDGANGGADTHTYADYGWYNVYLTVRDAAGATVQTMQRITLVDPANTAPIAFDDAYTTEEDVAVSGNLLTDGTPDNDPDGDALRLTRYTSPSSGTLSIDSTGAFTYTPDANFSGLDSFTYTIDDGRLAEGTATVTINVNSVNDAPVAAFSFNCAGLNCSFTDESSDPLDVGGNVTAWSWSFGDGEISLSQNPSHSYATDGTYTVTLTVTDNEGATATATETINTVNTVPVATANAYATDEDIAVSGNLLLDGTPDSDADGDTLTVTANTDPGNGVVTVTANGAFTYTPNANFNGPENFSYTVSDGSATATAVVNITVISVNDAPVAEFTVSCTGLECAFSDGSTDVEGAIASWSWSFGDGTTSTMQNPSHIFAAYGTYGVSLTVTDGDGATGMVSQAISVSNSNPVATDNAYTNLEDSTVTGNVLTDGTPDSDSDGDALSVTGNTSPSNGTIAMWADGVFTYTPNPDFNGLDSFNYTVSDGNGGEATATVSLTLEAVNDNPVANADVYTTAEDTAVSGNVLLDGTPDSDVDGDALTANLASNGKHGSATVWSSGVFTYTPFADFNGSDTFSYYVYDGNGGAAKGSVTVTVTPVNDPPVAAFGHSCSGLDCSFTDSSSDPLDSGGSIASWSWSFGDGAVSSAQNPNHSYAADGTYTVTLTVTDNEGATDTATQSVIAANTAPVATDNSYSFDEDTILHGNLLTDGVPDSDPDGDSLTLVSMTNLTGPGDAVTVWDANGDFSIAPNADVNGVYNFTYTVSDGKGGSATAAVTVTINPVNDPPVAVADSYTIPEDDTLTGNVIGVSDTDVDGDPLTVTANTNPSNGMLTIAADGIFTYTPNADFNGTDGFAYTIGDGAGGSDSATVTITVVPVNDAPVATDNAYATDEDVALTGNVLTDGTPDGDPDGDPLTVTANTNPSNGTLTMSSNGTFTYTPAADYNGSDSFSYTVSDGAGGTDSATVTITVVPANDAPVATDDAYSTAKNTAVAGNVLLDGTPDSDVDGDSLIAELNGSPVSGTVSLSADGNFTYTPDNGFSGSDSFGYIARDGNGGSAAATVTITVTSGPRNCQGFKCNSLTFLYWSVDTSSSAPAAPSDLAGSAAPTGTFPGTASSVTLRWTDNSNDEDVFVIERCDFYASISFISCSYQPVAEVAANITGYTETVAAGGHMYRVKARNARADSAYSNAVRIAN